MCFLAHAQGAQLCPESGVKRIGVETRQSQTADTGGATARERRGPPRQRWFDRPTGTLALSALFLTRPKRPCPPASKKNDFAVNDFAHFPPLPALIETPLQCARRSSLKMDFARKFSIRRVPATLLRATPNLRKPCPPQSFSDLLPPPVSCLDELIKHHFTLRAASGSLSPFRW